MDRVGLGHLLYVGRVKKFGPISSLYPLYISICSVQG